MAKCLTITIDNIVSSKTDRSLVKISLMYSCIYIYMWLSVIKHFSLFLKEENKAHYLRRLTADNIPINLMIVEIIRNNYIGLLFNAEFPPVAMRDILIIHYSNFSDRSLPNNVKSN